MALSVEVSEVVEHFQWLTQEQSRNLPVDKLAEVREEIGDVMIYLTELADKLGFGVIGEVEVQVDGLAVALGELEDCLDVPTRILHRGFVVGASSHHLAPESQTILHEFQGTRRLLDALLGEYCDLQVQVTIEGLP